MPTANSVMADLKSRGKESTRKIYARHGMAEDRTFGVSVADLKTIAKSIKRQQELACELYATGNMDAMYLAGMVADGAKLSRAQLDEWAASAAGLTMVSEYTVPWMAVEHPDGRAIALKWIASKEESVAASGWASYSGLVTVTPDDRLDLAEVEKLLGKIVKDIHTSPNRVRNAMNGFVISVGSYVKPLTEQAKAAAAKIGTVFVDKGDTACKVPDAIVYIEKLEAAGKAGVKKKTIRC